LKSILAASWVALAVLCTGCASVTQGTTHSLRIETVTEKGEMLDGADCTLTNDHGTTIAKSGSSTLVRRSSKDLEVSCAAGGQADARGRLVSRANAGLAGNILVGGAIGAVVDHNTGAAYTYPTWVRLVFGQFNVYDRRDEQEGTAMAPPGAVVAQGAAVRIEARPAAGQAAQPAAPQRVALAQGDTFDYLITDRNTGQKQKVVLRAERVRDGEATFNGGARVERADGTVQLSSALVSELDQVTPPQGWLPNGRVPNGMWKMRYKSVIPGSPISYELEASSEGEQKMVIDGRELRTVRLRLHGWVQAATTSASASRGSYEGTAWVSPELGRVVRYEARARGSANVATSLNVNEVVELVRFGRD
jgi:hypothetical protein